MASGWRSVALHNAQQSKIVTFGDVRPLIIKKENSLIISQQPYF